MTSLETLLVSAIVALVGGIVALWRFNNRLQDERGSDQREAARLVFALLQRLSLERGGRPPRTHSTASAPDYHEARELARKELNGEIEVLLKQYLDSDLPPEPLRKRRKSRHDDY